jgi:hypothetical protein
MLKMGTIYTNIFHSKGPPKFTQIAIFGLKTNHLVTLDWVSNPGSFDFLCFLIPSLYRWATAGGSPPPLFAAAPKVLDDLIIISPSF